MTTEFIIVVDSREQRPYQFNNSVTKALKTGDYSILGLEDRITIERKSKSDAYSTIGNGRERFICELERMAEYDYAAILIECNMKKFIIPPKFSKLNPRSAINSLLSWSIKYRVQVFFVDNRELGRATTYRLLEKYWKVYQQRKETSIWADKVLDEIFKGDKK